MNLFYQNGPPPLERRLACEAEGAPPPNRSPIELKRQIIGPTDIDRCTLVGALARQALIAEAELTPKPGLVDRRGPGAHIDLSLAMMCRSALAIEPFIRHMAFQSLNEIPSARLRVTLAATGRAAEDTMLRVTNGTNTHKGAIWTLGLLVAAAVTDQSQTGSIKLNAAAIAKTAGVIASFEDPHQSASISHGQIVARKFGVTGARGEAANGFPHIVEFGLPILRTRRRSQAPESVARLDALLSIMSELDDTCLLYRGGRTALQAAKAGATAVLRAGGAGFAPGRERLLELDARLLELGVSPGGSADLLAGTLFLDAIERQQSWPGTLFLDAIERPQSWLGSIGAESV